MKSILISGANRGLGLGLAQLYAGAGWLIHACCRSPDRAPELARLANTHGVRVHSLDVENGESVLALSKKLEGQPIDVLLNGAGFFGTRPIDDPEGYGCFGQSDFEDWARIFRVNVTGVMRLCEAIVENIAASEERKIIALTSSAASMGANESGNQYGYRASKAALNSMVKSMAINLADRGISTLAIHPGWAKTCMGGRSATVEVEVSARGIKARIDSLNLAGSGRFVRYDGVEMPW